MKKYLQIFKSNWQVDFEYRLNFLLGRVQNLIVLFTLYFLWASVFRGHPSVFGYSSDQIVTYVILAHLIRNLVFSSQVKFVGEEIQNGYLSSVLVRPVSYFWQSFSEDLARRVMTVITSFLEVTIFVLMAKPVVYVQANITMLLMVLVFLILSMLSYYLISFAAALVSFWSDEHFAPSFLAEVLILMLSGAMYPLDALPFGIAGLLKLLPFYYIVFFPINIYLGRVDAVDLTTGLVVLVTWVAVSAFLLRLVWRKGLQIYQAHGG